MIPEQVSERNQLDVADQVQAPSVGFLKLRLDNLHRHEIARRVAVAARRGARLMVVNANAHLATLAQRQSWLPELFSQGELQKRYRDYMALCQCDTVIVSSEAAGADLRTFSPESAPSALTLVPFR